MGITKVWIGSVSDPTQCMDLLRKRIVTLGGSYQSEYAILFDVFKQEQRHIDNWSTFIESKQSTLNSASSSNKHQSKDQSASVPLVPKHCLSIVQHSKFNLSLFTIYDRFVTESSSLLLDMFIRPFKLKQRIKRTIYIKNGDCYVWKDFIVSFGIVHFHTLPQNYILLEIEYKPCPSFDYNSCKQFDIVNEFFHWFISSISRITMARQTLKRSYADDKNNNNNDNNSQLSGGSDDVKMPDQTVKNAAKMEIDDDDVVTNESKQKKESDQQLEHFEHTYENEKIEWMTIPDIDWHNMTDISPQDSFDGRHLAVMLNRAFGQLR